MEKIFFKSSDFDKKIPKYYGVESELFEYDYDYLIKIFKTNDQSTLENKLKKIELLYQINMNNIIPLKLVYIDGIFKGFLCQNKRDYSPIDSLKEKRKERIEILKKVKEKLEELHDLGIYYGDLHQENILYNGNDVILCDMDNVYINGYKFDKNNIYISRYLNYIEKIDKRIDNYALNILTISYYQNIFFSYVFVYLYNNPHLHRELNTKKNYQIIYDLLRLNYDNFDDLLIDNLKRTLIL